MSCRFAPFWFSVSQLGWEVIVRFVDIGGIDDHHCLNFLFIIKDNFQQSLMSKFVTIISIFFSYMILLFKNLFPSWILPCNTAPLTLNNTQSILYLQKCENSVFKTLRFTCYKKTFKSVIDYMN
jgi:hypothetical protein